MFGSLVGVELAFLVGTHICIKGCGQVLINPSPKVSEQSSCQQRILPCLLGNGVSGWGFVIGFCPLEECKGITSLARLSFTGTGDWNAHLIFFYIHTHTHTHTHTPPGVTLVLVVYQTGENITTALEGRPGSLTPGSSLTTTSTKAQLPRYMYIHHYYKCM